MSKVTLGDLQQITELFKLISGVPVIVAGGAPRDIYLGHDVKDIDIFFPYCRYYQHWKKLQYHAKRIFGSEFVQLKPEDRARSIPTDSSNKVNSVWELTNRQGIKLQVILWTVEGNPSYDHYGNRITKELIVVPENLANKLMKTFDYDICKIAYYEGFLKLTTAFKKAVKNKSLVLVTPTKELTKPQQERAERLQKKLGFQFEHRVEESEKEVSITSNTSITFNVSTNNLGLESLAFPQAAWQVRLVEEAQRHAIQGRHHEQHLLDEIIDPPAIAEPNVNPLPRIHRYRNPR